MAVESILRDITRDYAGVNVSAAYIDAKNPDNTRTGIDASTIAKTSFTKLANGFDIKLLIDDEEEAKEFADTLQEIEEEIPPQGFQKAAVLTIMPLDSDEKDVAYFAGYFTMYGQQGEVFRFVIGDGDYDFFAVDASDLDDEVDEDGEE